jgi:hypothetical protein
VPISLSIPTITGSAANLAVDIWLTVP